jgi:hypothetical protein
MAPGVEAKVTNLWHAPITPKGSEPAGSPTEFPTLRARNNRKSRPPRASLRGRSEKDRNRERGPGPVPRSVFQRISHVLIVRSPRFQQSSVSESVEPKKGQLIVLIKRINQRGCRNET